MTAIQSLWKAYLSETPDRLKFIDAFLLFIMFSGIIQFLYCILVTNFPFNAFLAGCVVFSKLRKPFLNELLQIWEHYRAVRVDGVFEIAS